MGSAAEEKPPRVLEVRVQRLRLDSDEDKALCAGFDCGSEEWELQVSDFIARKIWLPGRDPEHTLLAIEAQARKLFGFGAWKPLTVELPQRQEPVPVARVCYFGVAAEFKGAVDAHGRKWASRLYSTLEEDAHIQNPSAPNMPFELFCDRRNAHGLQFWTSQKRGFEIIGPGYGELLRLVRMPPGRSA